MLYNARSDFCIIADAYRDYNRVAYLSRGICQVEAHRARLTARVRRLINDFLRGCGSPRNAQRAVIPQREPRRAVPMSVLWIPLGKMAKIVSRNALINPPLLIYPMRFSLEIRTQVGIVNSKVTDNEF